MPGRIVLSRLVRVASNSYPPATRTVGYGLHPVEQNFVTRTILGLVVITAMFLGAGAVGGLLRSIDVPSGGWVGSRSVQSSSSSPSSRSIGATTPRSSPPDDAIDRFDRNTFLTPTLIPAVNCIAHRGFAGVNVENTVPAVRAAVEAGADCVEIDVRRCGSGELVVFHDADLDRLTATSGVLANTSLSTLQSLSVLDSDATVPTLPVVFEAVPDDVTINVELKEAGLADDCLAVFDRFANDVLVSSFDADTLRELDGSGVPLAVLFASGTSMALDVARDVGCVAVHPYRRCCDAGFVDTAHGAGFDVNAWTVQNDTQADRLASLGVDGLIADAPRFCR